MYSRKTKIVCSIGPACDNDETIKKMILAGMNIARFNFSHGTYEWHKQAMERVRRVSSALRIPVAILLDTKGPEIRTGLVKDDGKITVSTGDKIELTADDSLCTAADGENPCHISISWKEALQKMKPGIRILIADGLVEFDVDEIQGEKIICTAKNSGSFGSKKNVNLIGLHAGLPIMSEKDKEDLRFGAGEDIDFVAASFVSFPEEVVQIKAFLKEIGANARVIAKIENEEGLDNIEEIVKEADGIMVARGDLGVEIPFMEVPVVQKEIEQKCRLLGKRVIIATEMLESMINNIRPTRAEISDVANAVYDGTSAIMLSGESAAGKYPVEAVKTMSSVAEYTEQHINYKKRFNYTEFVNRNILDAISHSTCQMAIDVGAKCIVVNSVSGLTVRMVSRFRAPVQIIGSTTSEKVYRKLALSWGVIPLLCEEYDSLDVLLFHAIQRAVKILNLKIGDTVVLTGGQVGVNSGHTNMIKVETVRKVYR